MREPTWFEDQHQQNTCAQRNVGRGEDRAAGFVTRIRFLPHAIFERTLGAFGRLLEALAVDIEEPTVIKAA